METTSKKRMMPVIALLVFIFLGGTAGYFYSVHERERMQFRTGNRALRVAVWGDVRPSCSTGEWDKVTAQMFDRLDKFDQQNPFDLIITTGDYICAWPREGEKALKQLEYILSKYPKRLLAKTVFSPGNHEIGHELLFRSSNFNMLSYGGYYDYEDLRIVVLPSEINEMATRALTPAWIDRAAQHSGRLIVARHEPPLSCGTNHSWIINQAQRAQPNLILYGHVHTWLEPKSTYKDCQRDLRLAPNELIVGNGGASGWKDKVGWAGFTVITLGSDGSSKIDGIDVGGVVRASATVLKPSKKLF